MTTKAIPEEEYLRQIKIACEGTGYKFIGWCGDFKGMRSCFNYECEEHGVQRGRVESFLKKMVRCRSCYNSRQRFSQNERENYVNQQCLDSPYRFVKWLNFNGKNTSKAIFNCEYHGEWISSVAVFVAGSRCKKCGHMSSSIKQRMNVDLRTQEVKNLCLKNSYEFLGWTKSYENVNSKIKISCSTHGTWVTKFSTFKNGSGCPACAKSGFNPDKISHLYCLLSKEKCSIKIGITNKIEQRISQLKTATPFEFSVVSVITREKGHEIRRLEKMFHVNFESSKLQGFQGCTEWLKYDFNIIKVFFCLKGNGTHTHSFTKTIKLLSSSSECQPIIIHL